MNLRAGVDTGGTFTDVVSSVGEVRKVLSTTVSPARAVADGLRQIGGTRTLAHGTTVATNALLERRGGRVALVTSPGQRDVIEIARQVRPSLYDMWSDRPEPLVARDLRFELEADGTCPDLPDDLDAVAICLLHADLYPETESAVARALPDRLPRVCSSSVSPEFREYERTVTTATDAYLRRPCTDYLSALQSLAPEVLVLTSAGGLVTWSEAARQPVALLLSGPAGGVAAAAVAGAATGFDDCVTLDMGGTSTDVCLVRGGRPEPAAQRTVAGFPIRMPSIDVHTIGAGGGSIAQVDSGGALVVGPRSAGAEPGPVCYGRGGVEVTVTDADLIAGRLPAHGLAGLGRLDRVAAQRAMDGLGADPEGVIAVVDEAMTRAVRAVTVQRGVDPRRLALVAFGGAGPLHACALADALGMPAVVVPPRAGVLSAVGILGAPRQVDRVRSCPDPTDHRLAEEMAAALASEVGLAGAEVEVAYDCRYAGQSHELTVAEIARFPDEHRMRSGYALDWPIEVVAVRATARVASPVDGSALPGPDRRGPIDGPAVVAEPDCTIWVAERWTAAVHPCGAWLLTRST